MRHKDIHKRSPLALVVLSLVVGAMLLMNSGCSVFMAAKQPDKKDLSVLDVGTPRSHVIAQLGAPAWSEKKDGERVDVIAFKQGYSKGARAGRAFFHGVADVFTLGLWEVAGTPIESVASGTDMKVEVIYDGDDRVRSVNFLEGEKPETSAEAGSPSGSPRKEDDPTTAPFRMSP